MYDQKRLRSACAYAQSDQSLCYSLEYSMSVMLLTEQFLEYLKTATLIISMFYQKELYEPWNLIQVSSKSVGKWASYWHLKNSIWPTFSRHCEHLISFQYFFNCLIFSYQRLHHLCFSRYAALYTRKMFHQRLKLIIHWFVFYFDNAYLIRLSDVTKPPIWPLPLQSICKYSNAHNFHIFQPF